MNDIEIARRLIERVGGAEMATAILCDNWRYKWATMDKYGKQSKKYSILINELRRQAWEK